MSVENLSGTSRYSTKATNSVTDVLLQSKNREDGESGSQSDELFRRIIVDRNRSEFLMIGQVEIFELIATGQSLSVVLDRIARLVEEIAGNLHCVIFQLDPKGEVLSAKAAPSMKKEFVEALQSLPVGLRSGTCGACIVNGEPQISLDVIKDSRWADHQELVLSNGIRSSWSTPVFDASRKPLGTISLLYDHLHDPEPHEIDFINVAAHQASIAIERSRTEQKLQASEARFRALIENSGDGISLTDEYGKYIYASPAVYRILGYEPEEIIGKTASERIHPDDWKMLTERAYALADIHGARDTIRYRVRHKNGDWLWVEAIFTNLLHEPSVQALVVNFRDITQSKLAEDALRASEERYRTLVASLDEGIILMDENAVLLASNASAEQILGLTVEQIKNRTLFDPDWFAIREDGSPFETDDFPAAITLRTGKPCSNVVMGVKKTDNRIVWISINTRPLFHEAEKKPYAVVISINDITERLKAQTELRDSEERFSIAFKSSPCPMALLTFPEGRFTNVNDAWQQAYGYSLEEVDGKTSSEIKLWKDETKRDEMYHRLIQYGEIRNFETVGLSKNGEEIVDLTSAEIIEFGGRKYLLSSFYDITERKLAERALRESEERYRLLFEHSFAGITRLKANGELIEWNDAITRMFGCSSREEFFVALESNLFFDLVDRQLLINKLIEKGRLQNWEVKMKRLDGSTIWALINASIFYPASDGEPLLEAIVLDITERKLTEQELQQVYAQSRSLLARLETVREEERAHLAREIHDNLGQMMTGLKLDFSWLEKRMARMKEENLRQEMEPKLGEIAQLLEETIQTVRNIATDLRPGVLDAFGLRAAIDWQVREFERRNGITCFSKLCQDPKHLPRETATALFRILQEILTNITRHAKADLVKVEMTKTGGEIRLMVADNGIGMSEGQACSPKSLGLLGMRERALIMGGSVTVASEKGCGTTVKVRMPIK